MARLPNLDDLSLREPLHTGDRRELLGIGRDLRGRFGGKLVLRDVNCTNGDVMNMLLEIPTGLHFTEVDIHCATKCLPSVVRLVEACSGTIVKLFIMAAPYSRFTSSQLGWFQHQLTTSSPNAGSSETFEFSKCPNPREVKIGVTVGWIHGGLPWIPTALSTLRPTTSPRLSSLRLDFTRSPYVNQSVESSIERMGDDLLWITDEVARIEREFEGAVNLIVFRDFWFGMVFDRLNVRLCFAGVGGDLLVNHFTRISQILQRHLKRVSR